VFSVVWLAYSTLGRGMGHPPVSTYIHVMTEMGKIQSVNHTVTIL